MLLNDALDDQVIEDESPLFNGGQVSYARASELEANQLALLINADISVAGKVTTRRGSTKIGAAGNFAFPVQGLAYYKTPVYSQLIALENGLFKYWDGAAWQPAGALLAFDTTIPVQMVQGNNLLWVAQAGFSLTYWDGTYNVVPPAGVVTPNQDPPFKPSYLEWHTQRLVAAGMVGLPDTVSFSKYILGLGDISPGTGWDHANWDIRVGTGDGDPVTGLRSWTNFNLIVFKEHSTWIVNCDPSLTDPTTGNISGFQVSPVHYRIGSMAPNSAVQVGADVFFLSTSGIRSVGRTLASENQFDVGVPLSQPISDIIERINPAGIKNVVATYWNNRYLCALPLDGATYPNFTVVYNTLTQSWSGYWTGWTPTAFTRRVDGVTAKLCFGQSDGSVTDFLDYVSVANEVDATFQDQTVGYGTTILSRGFTCGDRKLPKTGLFATAEFEKSVATVSVYAIFDGSPDMNLLEPSPFSTLTSGGIVIPFTLPALLPSGGILSRSLDIQRYGQWHQCQLQVVTTTGKVSLNTMGVGAFLDTTEIQR